MVLDLRSCSVFRGGIVESMSTSTIISKNGCVFQQTVKPKNGDGTKGCHARAQKRKGLCMGSPSPDGRMAGCRQVLLLCAFAAWRDIPSPDLGLMKRHTASANGAHDTSPGQRPGFARRKGQALKGRAMMGPPLQGFDRLVADHPGRCPGLIWIRTFGARILLPAKVPYRI